MIFVGDDAGIDGKRRDGDGGGNVGRGAVASEKQLKSHRLYSLLKEAREDFWLLSFALRWRWRWRW